MKKYILIKLLLLYSYFYNYIDFIIIMYTIWKTIIIIIIKQ